MKQLLVVSALFCLSWAASGPKANVKSAPVATGTKTKAAKAYEPACDTIDNGICTLVECREPLVFINGVCECPCGWERDPNDRFNCIEPHPHCCEDFVPGVVPPIRYEHFCGYGHCVDYPNGTITCLCDACHYGSQCQFTRDECITTGEPCHQDCSNCPVRTCPTIPACPTTSPQACESYVPDFFPPITYNDACHHGHCEQDREGNLQCKCDNCWAGPFCDIPLDIPGCSLEPTVCPCPFPGTCPECPTVEPCTLPTCPAPTPKTCSSVVSKQPFGGGITYAQACVVDPSNPHGECVDAGEGHVVCRCMGCWDGLFCEHYNTERCPPPECTTTAGPTTSPLSCASKIPGLESGLTYNQACEVDPSNSHGVCLDNPDGTRQCLCNECWTGLFCENNMCPPITTPCAGPPTTAQTPPITCSSLVPNLFPPQTYELACEVDPAAPHGHCHENAETGTLNCRCEPCWAGTFCEENMCPPTCPPPVTEPPLTCHSPIPDWANGKSYNDECGANDGRGVCEEIGGKLTCRCKKCWTGDFCEHNACIRRCSYNQNRPAFYHNPPSPYLYPQPVGGSDLPEELLACPPLFECVPDDKNCQYDRQECINNIGWCIPTKAEVESPAHPGDNVRAPRNAHMNEAAH